MGLLLFFSFVLIRYLLLVNMSLEKKGNLPIEANRIRITVSSTNVKNVEKVCQNFIENARKKEIEVKGPVRMSTKILRITTRKTPNGEGSKTWDRYEMRVHKRLIDLIASSVEIVKEITNVNVLPGVEIEVEVTV